MMARHDGLWWCGTRGISSLYLFIFTYIYICTVLQFTVIYSLQFTIYGVTSTVMVLAISTATVGMILDNMNVKYVKVSCTGARAYKKIITYMYV